MRAAGERALAAIFSIACTAPSLHISMPIQRLNPQTLCPTLQYGFSQVVAATGRRLVFISGQTAWDERQQLVGGTDLGTQARQALRNLKHAVDAAGGSLADVASLRIYFVSRVSHDVGAIGAARRWT